MGHTERARDDVITAYIAAANFDRAATEALRAYGLPVLRYLRSMLHRDDAACEVFSELSKNLWAGLPRFRHEASFRTWMYKLAWTAAQDWRRRTARDHVRRLETTEEGKLVAEPRSTTPWHERTDARGRWQAIKASLSAEDRSLLVLRLEQRLSWREAAEVMASHGSAPEPAALRKRFERLKHRLRVMAKEQGLYPKEQ